MNSSICFCVTILLSVVNSVLKIDLFSEGKISIKT
jgi:hypothetical protein